MLYYLQHRGLVQLAEQRTLIPYVGGSNPSAPARPGGIRDIQAAMALIIALVLIEFEKYLRPGLTNGTFLRGWRNWQTRWI